LIGERIGDSQVYEYDLLGLIALAQPIYRRGDDVNLGTGPPAFYGVA
jgi:hypothetical protein